MWKTRGCALGACALGLGGAALAQDNEVRWWVEVGETPVSPSNPAVVVRIWAEFPPPSYAFAAAIWDVHAQAGSWSAPRGLLWGTPFPSEVGTVSGSSVLGIRLGQTYGLSWFPDPSNPIAVWECTWLTDDFTPRRVRIDTSSRAFRVYPSRSSWASEDLIGELQEGRAFIRVVPAPSAAAALAFLFLARRRRSPGEVRP